MTRKVEEVVTTLILKILRLTFTNEVLICQCINKQNSAFDLCVRVDAEIIVDLLIVVPHCLVFCGNQTGIQTVKFEVRLFFEKLFNLLVLFVESYNLASFRCCPTVFDLLSAEHNELEVV